MSDKMIPIPFQEMLEKLLAEYREKGTFYGVPVCHSDADIPIGPAAGPHTQLAGNLIAGYAAGALYFELKTVQQLEGEALHISKPCIYVGNEVYNTEWSTELTVEQAKNEYIKAYLLLQVLNREFGLRNVSKLHFIMSVGYDFEGIRSEKVDTFLNDMKNAGGTAEWQQDFDYVRKHLENFKNITEKDIMEMESSDTISDTVTLSTMHGCKRSEIEKIALYLLKEKGLNTYIKMNPTLADKAEVRSILDAKGYTDIVYQEEIFDKDITLAMAIEIIRKCQDTAKQVNKEFGIKLTNTFPVIIKNNELSGSEMYLSGPILYPIAIRVADLLAEQLKGEIKISYSGGADASNIRELLETGIYPVTVSSLMLKPGGYKNLTTLVKKSDGYDKCPVIDLNRLHQLATAAVGDKNYDKKEKRSFERSADYDCLCARCNNCVDVCPNRANVRINTTAGNCVIHYDRLCNECGCCTFSCIKGHRPYLEKFTVFEYEKDFSNSNNIGVLIKDQALKYRLDETDSRKAGQIKEIIPSALNRTGFN